MDQNELKWQVAEAVLEHVEDDIVLGVGSGSTVNIFIKALANSQKRIAGAVSSSESTTSRLKKHGIRIRDLNNVMKVPLYIDGADETDHQRRLIKGGGGALTREKIIAGASEQFICIVDESKVVDRLGKFPLPVEVIPMARAHVSRQLSKLGGRPEPREAVITDNGNWIVDVFDLDISDPTALEREINNIAGVVSNGLFALRPADRVIVAGQDGLTTL